MATVKTNTDVFEKAWEGFKGNDWKEKASVSRFVQANYTPYDGDESFLAGPTERSLHIKKIIEETKAGYEAAGRFPMDTRATSIADIPAGFIDKENELIYGIQNDELFKTSIYANKKPNEVTTYDIIAGVKENDTVLRGQVIAKSGTCPLYSSDSNLHFELTYQGKLVNPESYYNKSVDEL